MNTVEERNQYKHIVRNSMITPDGTEIISRHRHDYVCHIDKNGEEYMVDGGLSYVRRSLNTIPAQDTTLYSDMPHEILRNEVTWGRRTRDGELSYIKLKQMSKAHIEAIKEDGYKGAIVNLMNEELKWRKIHESKSESKRRELLRELSYG